MMKLLISVSLLAGCNGFVVSPASQAKTALNVATQPPIGNGKTWDDWSKKPIPPRESTTPVAKKNVSKMERAMMKDRVIEPNFYLAAAVALLGPLIAWYHPCKFCFVRISLDFVHDVFGRRGHF